MLLIKYSLLTSQEKKLKPDLAFKLDQYSSDFFVVEIKDDTLKNFKLSNLLHQSIDYKNSSLNGIYPKFSFICTFNLLKNKADFNQSMIGLAAKLGVGRIYCTGGDNLGFKLQIGVGSQIFYRCDLKSGSSEYINFEVTPKINIGTFAKTNKTR